MSEKKGIPLEKLLELLLKFGPGAVDAVMGLVSKGSTHVSPEEWPTIRKILVPGEQLIPERAEPEPVAAGRR